MTDPYGDIPDFAASVDFDVDTDVLFDVLSNPRRRFVLARLDGDATPKPLRDIAYQLATWEYDAAITEIPASDVTSTYVSLYHVHIPKMADAGFVEYCAKRDAVALVENGDSVTSLADSPTVG